MMDANIALKSYFKDLKNVELLSGIEQTDLAVRAKKGDAMALDQLVKSNLRFVVTVAKDYIYSKIPLEDLISEGNIGLIKALDKFDETKKIKFISYAVWWVRQSITQSIYDNGSVVRTPVNRININNKISKTTDVLFKELNREPTAKEISDFCQVCEVDIKNSYSDCSHMIDFDNKSSDNSIVNLVDYLEDDSFEQVNININRQAVNYEIKSVLSGLSKRENDIINMYFGLNGGEEKNLREIGVELRLTNERVRQIKDFALKKLRTYNNSYRLKEYLNYSL